MSNRRFYQFIGILFIIFIGYFGYPIFLKKPIERHQINDNFSKELNINNKIYSSTEELPNEYSPFFNHFKEDGDLYYKLILIEYSQMLYRHSFNNTDIFNITDSNVYSADHFYYLMSAHVTKSEFFVPIYYKLYKQTELWDNVSGGFYTKVDENVSKITDEKRCFDNALAILGLIAGLEFEYQSPDIPILINEFWPIFNNLFWDSNAGLYNYSNIDGSKYVSDNLLTAISLFNILKYSDFNSLPSLLSEVKSRAVEVMEEINSSFYISAENYPGFKESSNDSDKYLLTNALGIIALLEWNIVQGFSKNSKQVQQAIKIYNFLKSRLYNSTYNMYNFKSDMAGVGSFDFNLKLKENSWMLKATTELFKATGNITYYKDALDLFYGIEQTLYDPSKKGYFDVFGPNGSDIKSLDGYCMFQTSLYDLKHLYDSAKINIHSNQSSYLYLNTTAFNVTINVNYSMQYSYSSGEDPVEVNSSWNYEVPIENVSLKLILRYENNSIVDIIDEISTNSYGNYTFIYDITKLPMGKYYLTVLANKTGYCLEYETKILEYTSGLIIIEYIKNFEVLYQGENRILNVSIGSIRTDNITCNLSLRGVEFEDAFLENILVQNYTLTYALINLTVKDTATTGIKNITLSLYNNSILLYNKTFEIEVSFGVEVESVSYSPYIIDNNPITIKITLFNHRETLTEHFLEIATSGDFFIYSTQNLSAINPLERKVYSITLIPKNDIVFGAAKFNINLSKYGETIYNKNYTINFVPSLIINKISSSSVVIHGQKPILSLEIQNYNMTPQKITVKINGQISWSNYAYFGENRFNIDLDKPYFSPYNIQPNQYFVEIYKGDILIAKEYITISHQISIMELCIFYIAPIAIPLVVVVFFKYKQIEFEKRIK